MPKKLFMCLFFGCFGMASEICFVAFGNLVSGTSLWNEPLWSLTGKTYVWMFPIYMLIPLIGGRLFKMMLKYPLLTRLITYTAIIFSVEFAAGFLLDEFTGKCPWEYTAGWEVMGYIRLDFAPAWMAFSFIVEYLFRYLEDRL